MISNIISMTNDDSQVRDMQEPSLPFPDYINRCREIIAERRLDTAAGITPNTQHIINANCPYELYPDEPLLGDNNKLKYGALLIHGLFDCPFSVRDLGSQFQKQGILCRSILLPGHGTNPSDLISVSYHDWIHAVHYGIETLKKEVNHIFLVGYSTGAALSVYHALRHQDIAGLVLIAPAMKIKAPVDSLMGWHHLVKWFRKNRAWVYKEDELDYTKYSSIPFNPVDQLSQLTYLLREMIQKNKITCPMYMVASREDETVSSHTAIDFFSSQQNPASRLLLYTSCDHQYPDKRITTRPSQYPDLKIQHFSHIGIPYSPNNTHYGQYGDYVYASNINNEDYVYGAYNTIEANLLNTFYRFGVLKNKRRALTYNPDFDFMASVISEFILNH